ncbi:uncharacterized protein LOC129408661 [Boleophthalmus pectinirostris]|uniref:uncharacterized protein LOC129408661 n=1 Tax=Boleophthalmus pectinirostris TaxID=150288 RepID=UPI00242C5EDE|nr:uncharacterized protein LOC129408661 [Boleophthalmus pectinirostris]
MRFYLLFYAQLRFAMNWKQKGYCLGVVVICTIAISFHLGASEPVDYSARPSEHPGFNNDMESALTAETLAPRSRERRHRLGSRKPSTLFMKTKETFGETSKFTQNKPKMETLLDQNQNNPSIYFNTNCSRGQVKPIVYGRFDYSGTDVQAQIREELQPVVECAADSMTLTVRTRAVQLRISTGNDSSLPLSKIPFWCGFSVHKNIREISVVAHYNGCHVTVQNNRHVLSLLWRRTAVRISCPVSLVKSQALDGLSLCCSPSDLTISIQGQSVSKEPNVNVRGEWTPLLELVQHCGYSLKRGNAEIVITVPFLACGITSRGGNHTLSIQLMEEVFFFSCPIATKRSSQSNQAHESTATKTKPVTPDLKPNQWAQPFYLAPPYYPRPTRHHRDHVPQVTPPLRTMKSPLKKPQQDEQGDQIRPPEDYYSMRTSLRDSSQIFPDFKDAFTMKHPPPSLKGSSPSMPPHHYVFNPYYHYYHLPKIPQNPGSTVEPRHSSEAGNITPLFYLNSATDLNTTPPPLLYAFLQHDLIEKINFGESQKPVHGTSEVYKQHNMKTDDLRINPNIQISNMNDQRAFVTMTPAGESTPSAKHSTTFIHPLPYNYYQLFSGPKRENHPIPASILPPQQSADPIIQSADVQQSFGSDFQPVPELFVPVHDAAETLMNERQSTPYSDLSPDHSRWEEWVIQAAPVNYAVFPLMSVLEEHPEDASVQGQTSASMTPPFDAPSCPGTVSHFHCSISLDCSALPVEDCILGEYLLFSLPESVGEPKVSDPDHSKVSCAIGHLTSSPKLYFVSPKDCGVTTRVSDSLINYQLELETCDSANSLMSFMVECSFYPGFLRAEPLFILDPLPPQYTAATPVQMRLATDESLSFQPLDHLPLHSLRGRLVYIELTLLPPDPSVALWVHYCLAYTLTPYASAILIYDGCSSESTSQHLLSVYPNTKYIVVISFLSFTSPSPLVVDDVNPEVYFFCSTEVCSAVHGVCSVGCINCNSEDFEMIRS